jgi:hypothetical protein
MAESASRLNLAIAHRLEHRLERLTSRCGFCFPNCGLNRQNPATLHLSMAKIEGSGDYRNRLPLTLGDNDGICVPQDPSVRRKAQ